jgi:F0F1-type ATP synthase membrane subunit c/vacuolar-type H+-ATPase subunit K
LVKGIHAGNYGASKDNKALAVRAAALLSEATQSWSTSALWQAVAEDPEKAHSSQMYIVLALWKNGLIVRK